MGWASGSEIMSNVIKGVKPVVADKESRKTIYRPIISALEESDWDSQDECVGEDEAYDEIYFEAYPTDSDD